MVYLILILILSFIFITLGKKWEIKRKIVFAWSAFTIMLGCLLIFFLYALYPNISEILSISVSIGTILVVSLVTVLVIFFRDPERSPPGQKRCILSPADGTVVYVKEIKKGEFPFSIKGRAIIPLQDFTSKKFMLNQGIQIGIGMNLLNVHVNRTPIKGNIVLLKKIPGNFKSLKHLSSLLENERVLTVIKYNDIEVGVVQIASRLVRRIVSYVNEGDFVEKGQRIGMIRFGSQVDLLIPYQKKLKIHFKPGEELQAGTSIVATY